MTPRDTAGRDRSPPELDLAVAVRRALSTLDGTGADLARRAGVPPRRLARVRRGAARPTPAEVAALADALAARREGGAEGQRADLAERVLRMALEMRGDAGR
jgi:transcriptional regulator with XRE-family HTH domain